MTRDEAVAIVAAIRGALPDDRAVRTSITMRLEPEGEPPTSIYISGINPMLVVSIHKFPDVQEVYYTHPDMYLDDN